MVLLLALVPLLHQTPNAAIRAVAYVRADPDGVGTGFLLAGDPPRVVTCRHVVGERKTADVFFPMYNKRGEVQADRADVLANRVALRESGHLQTGKVILTSDTLDLAILELSNRPPGVGGLSLAMRPPSLGETIWAVGCRGDLETLWNLTRGTLRQTGPLRDGYFWQGKKLAADAPGLALQLGVDEGDSGGPVLNHRGEVVGLISAVRRRVPETAVGPGVQAIRQLLKQAEMPAEAVPSDPLARATVWISPLSTDRRTAGVIVDAKRKRVLTSNRAIGEQDRIGVVFPLLSHGKIVGDRDAYRDPIGLHLAGHWSVGRVLARDPYSDLALIEVDHLPAWAHQLPVAVAAPVPGTAVRAISHPLGLEFVFAHSAGHLRQRGMLKLDRTGPKVPALLFQLPLQANAAGGPIVNQVGELIGIQAATDAPNGIGYSADLPKLRAFLARAELEHLAHTARVLFHDYASVRKLLALATTDSEVALALNPDSAPARLRRAKELLAREKFAEAIAMLDQLLTQQPQHECALKLRAECYLHRAEPKAAQADLQRLLSVQPADAPARLLAGRAAAAAGDEPRAAGEFASTVRLSPKFRPAVCAAIAEHADHLDRKGLGSPGEWLWLALSAVAKIDPDSPLAKALQTLPADAKARTRYLRNQCGEPK